MFGKSLRPWPPSAHKRAPTAASVGVIAALVAAVLVRFSTLALDSLWFDEAQTVRLLRMPLGEMLAAIGREESTPPLYYVLARAWTSLFGDSEAGLRSLSAVAGVLTVPAGAALARELGSRTAAATCAALVCMSPLLVWYSREARSYALYVLFVTVCLAAFARVMRAPAARAAGARWSFALAGALAIATHWFALAPVLLAAVAIVASDARALRALPPPQSGGRALRIVPVLPLAVAVALAPLLLEQRARGHTSFIADTPLGQRLLELAKQLLVGFDAPVEPATTLIAGSSCAALVLAALAPTGRLRAHKVPASAHSPVAADGHRAALAVASVTALSACAPVALALVGSDYLLTRNLAWVAVVLAALAACGAARLGRRIGVVLCVVLFAASASGAAEPLLDPLARRPDWRGIAELARARLPQDGLLYVAADGVAAVRFYAPRLRVTALGSESANADARVPVVMCAEPARKHDPGDQPRVPDPLSLPCLAALGAARTPLAGDTSVRGRLTGSSAPRPSAARWTVVATFERRTFAAVLLRRAGS